jgi:mannose/fructose/sorbose-specific phosphotransferase system IIB component
MNIVLLRIDDRLIHGQVAVGWSRTLSAERIVVVNDAVAKDSTQKFLLQMAAPSGISVPFSTVEDAVQAIQEDRFGNQRLIVLARSPIDIYALIQGGLQVEKVNIGNVRYAEGKKKLTKEVSASEEELEAMCKMKEMGIRLEAQWLPDHKITLINDYL